MKRTKSTFLALVSVLLSPMAANADLLGVDLNDVPFSVIDNDSWTLGFEFNLSSEEEVSGLGFFDAGDGFADTMVGLWDTSGNLLGSVSSATSTVTSFATGNGLGTWNFMDFSFVLGPGSYVIGSWGDGMEYAFTFSPNSITTQVLTFADTREIFGGIFQYPSNEFCDSCDSGFFGANIRFGTTEVPEPGTLALLGIGLAVMGLARRRKKA